MERNRNFLAIAVLIFVLILPIGLVAADVPPPVYGVDIVDYNESLTQVAGTTETYEVTVKNIGAMGMSEVRLDVDRIDPDWFSSTGTAALDFGETAVLIYDLTLPEDAEGMYAFSLVVFGTSGTVTVSNKKIVSLDVIPLPSTPPTTQPPTTTTTLPFLTTTTVPQGQPPQPSISKDGKIFYVIGGVCILILVMFLVKKFF